MSSTYDLVKEDFIHETPLSTSNIQDDDNKFLKKAINSIYDLVEENFIHEFPLTASNIHNLDNITDPSENDLVVNPYIDETIITAKQGQIGPVTCCKKVSRILPTPVCRNNLLCMRHERTCHVFKGFVGKCAVCGEKFTTSKLIWNAVKLWNGICSPNNCQSYFESDVIFPLSKEQIDIVALRISYDMEYLSRHPNDT
jgi:hypothetical protein